MSYAIPRDAPGGTAPAVLSVFVHVLFFVFLYFGVRWQSRQADAVVVEIWNQLPVIEQPAPKAEPGPESKPEPKVEPRPEPKPELKIESRLEPKPAPKIESAPQKPDIAAEREKKRPKKERSKKAEPPLKFDTPRRIKEQLAQEQQALDRTRERQDALKAFSPPPAAPVIDPRYANKIRATIRSNIVLPLGINGNPELVFYVVQLPTGDVIDIGLRKSSGNKVLDDAVERAIRKSSPLPKPDRPDQFQRELTINYRPFD
jgi:colicin import membrane protein